MMSVAKMLDRVKQKMGYRTDAQLCTGTELAAPVISKLRSGALPPGPMLWLRLHELTEMPTLELKAWAGM